MPFVIALASAVLSCEACKAAGGTKGAMKVICTWLEAGANAPHKIAAGRHLSPQTSQIGSYAAAKHALKENSRQEPHEPDQRSEKVQWDSLLFAVSMTAFLLASASLLRGLFMNSARAVAAIASPPFKRS